MALYYIIQKRITIELLKLWAIVNIVTIFALQKKTGDFLGRQMTSSSSNSFESE